MTFEKDGPRQDEWVYVVLGAQNPGRARFEEPGLAKFALETLFGQDVGRLLEVRDACGKSTTPGLNLVV